MAAQGDIPLALALKARIRESGPISVADYVGACLNDAEHGYYSTRPAIGVGGDFITAPEISQIFGEIVGLWTAVVWQQMGSPSRLRLVELGPGRATLMRDVLRTTRRVDGLHAALAVDLVESNATLRDVQQQALQGETVQIRWHESVDAFAASADAARGDGATIMLANEFLDALPVEQAIFTGGRWHRRGVRLSAAGVFEFCALDAVANVSADAVTDPQEGDVFETRPAVAKLVTQLANSAASQGGPLAALFIDYGHARSAAGDTLQAVRQQKYVSPFETPGLADLSAHVDFEAFGHDAGRAGLAVDGPASQGVFLGSLGALERASRLMTANPDKAPAIEADIARLMSPNGMGSRFKAIGLRYGDLPELPGFDVLDNTGRPA